MKVAGVRAGKITALDLDRRTLHALVEFQVTENGFGSLRADVTCATRPQSLIGEYYLDCEPGTSPTLLKPGSVIPVTGPARPSPPTRHRHLPPALPRAPADHHQRARRRGRRQRRQPARGDPPGQPGAARDRPGAGDPGQAGPDPGGAGSRRRHRAQRAGRQPQGRRALRRRRQPHDDGRRPPGRARRGIRRLPGFLAALQPAMCALGAVAANTTPALRNLDASATQLKTLLDRLGPFATASRPAFRALGRPR